MNKRTYQRRTYHCESSSWRLFHFDSYLSTIIFIAMQVNANMISKLLLTKYLLLLHEYDTKYMTKNAYA